MISFCFLVQSNGPMPEEKGSGSGDLPWQGRGESDDDRRGEKNLQLQGDTLWPTSPRQPKVQEARAYQLLVRHPQLQKRSEQEPSAPRAFPGQTISGRWYRGLSLSQCLHQGITKVLECSCYHFWLICLLRPRQGHETDRLLPATNEKEELLPVCDFLCTTSCLKLIPGDRFPPWWCLPGWEL